jgi:hypothetical protein
VIGGAITSGVVGTLLAWIGLEDAVTGGARRVLRAVLGHWLGALALLVLLGSYSTYLTLQIWDSRRTHIACNP